MCLEPAKQSKQKDHYCICFVSIVEKCKNISSGYFSLYVAVLSRVNICLHYHPFSCLYTLKSISICTKKLHIHTSFKSLPL